MRSVFLSLSFLVVAFGGNASADPDKQLLCKPLNAAQQTYQIRCSVVSGRIQEQGCSCNSGFVLVDPSATPSEVPPRNSSAQ